MQITIEDLGPKVLSLGTAGSNGFNHFDLRGTYPLSNLLQELTMAKEYGRKNIILDEERLNENPVHRLARLIKDSFWPNLTRRIDGSNIAQVRKTGLQTHTHAFTSLVALLNSMNTTRRFRKIIRMCDSR